MGQSQNDRRQQLQELRERRLKEEAAKKKQENKIVLFVILGIVAVLAVAGIITLITAKAKNYSDDTTVPQGATDYVKMTVSYTDADDQPQQGEIIIHLRGDIAPVTASNFQRLVAQKFYDGLTFHRIMETFMIQGGDPDGNGTGGSEEHIYGEFSANGFNNTLGHKRGVISMARATDYNSASSQFFIVTQTSDSNSYSLDGKYAAFGEVVSGMEVVDGIAKTEVTYSGGEKSSPVHPVTIVKAEFVNGTD